MPRRRSVRRTVRKSAVPVYSDDSDEQPSSSLQSASKSPSSQDDHNDQHSQDSISYSSSSEDDEGEEYVPDMSKISSQNQTKKRNKSSTVQQLRQRLKNKNPIREKSNLDRQLEQEQEKSKDKLYTSAVNTLILWALLSFRTNKILHRADGRRAFANSVAENEQILSKLATYVDKSYFDFDKQMRHIFGLEPLGLERLDKQLLKQSNKKLNDLKAQKALMKNQHANSSQTQQVLKSKKKKLPSAFILRNQVDIKPQYRKQYNSLICNHTESHQADTSLLFIILLLIEMSGGILPEQDLISFLTTILGTFGEQNSLYTEKHPLFGNIKTKIDSFCSKWYLSVRKSDITAVGQGQREFLWGIRSHVEFSKPDMLEWVGELLQKPPEQAEIDNLRESEHLFYEKHIATTQAYDPLHASDSVNESTSQVE